MAIPISSHSGNAITVPLDQLCDRDVRHLQEADRDAHGKAITLSQEVPSQEVPSQEDPWKHRSAGMQCRTCMYASWKEPVIPSPCERKRVGRCRRHAPTMNGYPAIFEADWCGDHKLDENRVV